MAIVLAALMPGPASADDAATMVGTGSISPGLPTTGCAYQNVSFSGTVVDVGLFSGVYGIAFHGDSSICETVLSGSGSGTLSGDISGYLEYSRTGSIVSMNGVVTIHDVPGVLVIATCLWEPTAINPATSYQLSCTWVIDRPVTETTATGFRETDAASLTISPGGLDDVFQREPNAWYDVVSSCTYRVHRPTGIATVVGKTKAGRQPRATATSIRCRFEDPATGTAVFDQTKVAADDTVVLDGSFTTIASSLRICTQGEGWWADDHHVTVGLLCR